MWVDVSKKLAKLSDFDTAVRMREVIHALAREAIEKYRPQYKVATVLSVDRTAMKASVILETDTEPVSLIIPSGMGPWQAGDLVLVNTALGALKVEKIIYSPVFPGGTHLLPMHVSPNEGSAEGFISRRRELISSDGTISYSPLFLGRWVLDDSALYVGSTPSHWIETKFRANLIVGNDCVFDLIVDTATVNDWTAVAPFTFVRVDSYGASYALEYRTDVDDDGRFFVELRIRLLTSADVTLRFVPWRIDVEVFGNFNKDSNFPPGLTSGTLSTTVNLTPGVFDSGVSTSTNDWVLTGGGSPAHSIATVTWRLKNGRVTALVRLVVGSAITVPSDGNITNSIFGYVPTWLIPPLNAKFSTTNTGPVAVGYVSSVDGAVLLSAVDSAATLGTGVAIQGSAEWDL